MTDARLEEIRAREQAATPGPWRIGLASDGEKNALWAQEGESEFGPEYEEIARFDDRECVLSKDDDRFIAHAREDIPALLAEITRTRALVDAATTYVRAHNRAAFKASLKQRFEAAEATNRLLTAAIDLDAARSLSSPTPLSPESAAELAAGIADAKAGRVSVLCACATAFHAVDCPLYDPTPEPWICGDCGGPLTKCVQHRGRACDGGFCPVCEPSDPTPPAPAAGVPSGWGAVACTCHSRALCEFCQGQRDNVASAPEAAGVPGTHDWRRLPRSTAWRCKGCGKAWEAKMGEPPAEGEPCEGGAAPSPGGKR